MGKIKDALKKLAYKISGKESKGYSISSLVEDIAENYQQGSAEEKPVIELTFRQSDSIMNIQDEIYDYMLNNDCTGCIVKIEMINVPLYAHETQDGSFEGVIGDKTSIEGDDPVYQFDLIMGDYIQPMAFGAKYFVQYKAKLKVHKNHNRVDLYITNIETCLRGTVNEVSEGGTDAVNGMAVYNFFEQFKPRLVNVEIADIETYQEALTTYMEDYLRGLGKFWYFDLVAMQAYECFASATIVIDGEGMTPIPTLKYIDSNGDIQVVAPEDLSQTSQLMYQGIHYGVD